MNLYDSELVAGILSREGFKIVSSKAEADIILVTGCTVREHADQRALSYLSQVISRKKKRPGLKIGLIGCLGQRIGPNQKETLPGVDLVLGPDAYRNLPFYLRNLPENAFVEADNPLEDYDEIVPLRKEGASAWIAISRGCDTRCTYCIVPYMRGPLRSRPVDSIIHEVEKLVDEGFVEVTLLGQNVNAYRSNGVNFPGLLGHVSKVSGIRRVRFTTSHPMDMSEELVYVIRDHENICSHVHLPVQSGSNRILKRMGRHYTSGHYMSLIELLKREIPSVSITTDIISGFPGETGEDHRQTVDLVRDVDYDAAFTFKYSPRAGTPAYKIDDDVPENIKIERLTEISSLQREISARKNSEMIGKTVETLIETRSKRSPKDALGKTDGFKNVIVAGCELPPGTFCEVEVTGASSQTLFGRMSDSNNQ